jgi:hypothetical protein
LASAWVSRLETYVTSYPSFSNQKQSGNSQHRNSPDPIDNGWSTTCGYFPYGRSKLTRVVPFNGLGGSASYSESFPGHLLYACHVVSLHWSITSALRSSRTMKMT